MQSKDKLKDELIKGRFYYYHTTYSIKAYEYFINNQWRSSRGYYGLGLYGYAFPPSPSASTYGDIVFRCQVLRFHRLFFVNVDLGKQAFTGYSAAMGLNILDEHGVPDKYIKKGTRFGLEDVLKGENINKSVLYISDASSKCFLNNYDFDGMAYKGDDGYAILFWNFSPQLLRITGVKRKGDFDFKDIPVGASQKDVEAILKGTYKAPNTPGSKATVSSLKGMPATKYLSPSVLKHISVSAIPSVINRVASILTDWQDSDGKYSNNKYTEDVIFIESWYIRYNVTGRNLASLYPSFSPDALSVISAAAHIFAYACTDSKVTAVVSDTKDRVDVKRLTKYLFPFSLKNHFYYSVWEQALKYLALNNTRGITYVPLFHSSVDAKNVGVMILTDLVHNRDIWRHTEAFLNYVEKDFGVGLVEEYNKRNTTVSFGYDGTLPVKQIDQVDNTGIYFK